MAHWMMIAYDVGTPWTRYRVDKLLGGYGMRVQNSVFECRMSNRQLPLLRQKMQQILQSGDRVNYYCLCPWCQESRVVQGAAQLPNIDNFWDIG